MDKLARSHTRILAFDCEFWRTESYMVPREIGGFIIEKKNGVWKYDGEFLATFSPPPKHTVSYVSSGFAAVTASTKKKMDIIQSKIENNNEPLQKESVRLYLADKQVKKYHKPPSFLATFLRIYATSLIIVKGRGDIDALKHACKIYGIPYREPAGIVDIATWNKKSHAMCGTAKLEGTYECLKHDMKHYDFLPLGHAHDPRSDAAMTFLIALYISSTT